MGGGGQEDISKPSSQFCRKPKTSLNDKVLNFVSKNISREKVLNVTELCILT